MIELGELPAPVGPLKTVELEPIEYGAEELKDVRTPLATIDVLGKLPVPVVPVKAVELELTGYGAEDKEDVMPPPIRIDKLPVDPITVVMLETGYGAYEVVEDNTPLTSLVVGVAREVEL